MRSRELRAVPRVTLRNEAFEFGESSSQTTLGRCKDPVNRAVLWTGAKAGGLGEPRKALRLLLRRLGRLLRRLLGWLGRRHATRAKRVSCLTSPGGLANAKGARLRANGRFSEWIPNELPLAIFLALQIDF